MEEQAAVAKGVHRSSFALAPPLFFRSANAVHAELERLRLRQRQAYEQTNDLLDKLIVILSKSKASLQSSPSPMNIDSQSVPAPVAPAPLLAPMMQQVQQLQVAQKLSNEQKDMNAAIGRVIKAIERGYPVEMPEFLFEHPPLDPKLLAQVGYRFISFLRSSGLDSAAPPVKNRPRGGRSLVCHRSEARL